MELFPDDRAPEALGVRRLSLVRLSTEIAKAVARQFDVTLADLRTGGRTAATALPRQVAMSLAREITGQPLERIAGYFGRSNHGTVIHAHRLVKERIKNDEKVRQIVSYLDSQFQR